MIGQRFNKWTIVGLSHNTPKASYYNCVCDCGIESKVRSHHLLNGESGSCGCYMKNGKTRIKHGMTSDARYYILRGMMQRCDNPKSKDYKNYGAKGITVCKEWQNPFEFIKWLEANNWVKGMHVCRKGDIGNYSPDNCYVATLKQNLQDRKNNKLNMWKARVIRVMKDKHGWTNKKQAEFWGVNKNTISGIVTNRNWVNASPFRPHRHTFKETQDTQAYL